MKNWFLEMLSTESNVSSMRFFTFIIVGTIMANYTFLNIYSMLNSGVATSMSVTDITSLVGVLGIKLGQKQIEKKLEQK